MKTIKHIFTTLLLLCTTVASAHDFEVEGIYYTITDATNKTVEVTYRGSYYNSYDNEYTGSVVIPESVTYDGTTYSVTSIGEIAFRGCTGLTSITIPNSVTSIEHDVFAYCTGLTSITIPNSVTSIENYAFLGCKELTSITIPNSVTSIGNHTFDGCKGLTSITIPNSDTSIGNYAFLGCTGLTSITIPNSVTSIGNNAFDGCTGLTSITIPNSVTSIESYAFYYCTGLTSVVIPNSVTSIEDYAFYYCSGLTSIEIPNSVTSIGKRAFRGCSGLASIVIGNSVTSIGNYAFEDCTGLKTVINFSNLTFSKGSSYNGYVAGYADKVYNAPSGSIEGDFIFGKPNDVNTLLYYLGNAKEITLPADYNGENYVIGNDAFNGCSGLTSIEIPDSVTSIGHYAFYGCENLKNIVLGKRVNYIGDYAFATSNKIETIYALPTRAINCENTTTVFHQNAYKYATLYVRESSIDSYETTEPWSKFYIEPIGNFTLTYMVDGEVYKKEKYEYDSEITPLAQPEKEGHTFSGWSEIPETMPAEDITVTGSFSVNSYDVTFIVDGEVYQTVSVNYGETITLPEEPTKEGHTFSGWDEIPETMPAQDVVIEGSFCVNNYTITYIVDGEEYKVETSVYGTEITPAEAPTKEGHTFSGWSEIPSTMPAYDVTVIGSFSVNSYNVIFLVDNALYTMQSVKYGEAIELPEPPQKEGFVFDGWDGLPESMPAKDIVLIAIFTDITGIDDVKSEIGKVKTVYDLNGRAVENPTTGIYIVDGKKVFVK